MPFDTITYFSGISNAIYAIICLLCGLQLCFGIFSQRRQANTYLSRIFGSCLLVLFVSGVCYLLSRLSPDWSFLYRIGASIDMVIFIGYTMMGYALHTNNEPTRATLIILASPFVLCAILNICFPNWLTPLFFVAAAILFAYYIYFGVALQRREHLLGDIYSDPEAHSLRWIWTTIVLFIGWWVVSGLFQLLPSLQPWYNIATFVYMSVLFLFIFAKISNYKRPVSLAIQQEMEHADAGNNDGPSPDDNYTINRLRKLMQEEKLYLNSDLTIENVATRLETTPQYLSAILHKDVRTSFAQFVNGYRVERAKELLRTTSNKVEYIGLVCGFNSPQVFRRTFAAITGVSPTDFRNQG